MLITHTPLWPAGHLPLDGGDRLTAPSAQLIKVEDCGRSPKLLISPLEGEMAGRPEGGGGRQNLGRNREPTP
jgi:assimilatory nitrate reductase catalytic subunit